MVSIVSKAQISARNRGEGVIWLDHVTLAETDLEWLADVQRLTLWNVRVPPHFLGRLSKLWWLDWRGGGVGQGIEQIGDCDGLRYLSLNQIRGLTDLSFLFGKTTLELIDLYGLTRLERLPSLASLTGVRRAQVGQMKSMDSIGPVLEAPNLEELLLQNFVRVSAEDVTAMQDHPKLKTFGWFAENVPVKTWLPVREAVALPETRGMHPEEWFGLKLGSGSPRG